MPFSLRNIFIGLLGFFFVLGVLFVLVSTIVFFGNLNEEVMQEKEIVISSVAQLLFSEDLEEVPDSVIRAALAEPATQRGVQAVHLVDVDSGRVMISTESAREGAAISVPPYTVGAVETTEEMVGGTDLVHFTYGSGDGRVLWLAYEQLFLTGPTLVLAIQQTFLFASLIALFAVALYIIGNNFIVTPLQSVQRSLRTIGQGDLSERLPAGPPNEFGQLFATFNRMAEQLEASRERDKRVSDMKSNFISTAAHQLRTPITGVRWGLQSLKNGDFGDVNEQQIKILGDAEEKTKELSAVVSTLLDIAGLEEGQTGYNEESASFRELLETIVAEYNNTDAMAEHEFTASVFPATDPNDPVTLSLDVERMRWVVRNLLDNARNYTPEGGTITLTAECGADGVTVQVADTGVGIPPKEQDNIFNKFYRASNAVRVKSNGNGLGLFIAKSIVEHHGGTLTFTSREGEGTTFMFTLPRDGDKSIIDSN